MFPICVCKMQRIIAIMIYQQLQYQNTVEKYCAAFVMHIQGTVRV
jgi:hypothetical protein